MELPSHSQNSDLELFLSDRTVQMKMENIMTKRRHNDRPKWDPSHWEAKKKGNTSEAMVYSQKWSIMTAL